MDLIDRYLRAVRFWLPRTQRQEILAEVSDDIRSEIEDREAELGRPIGHADVEAILTRWGHPMRVTERYLPQRSLIGPVLLPAYTFVLQIVTLVYLVPWLLVFLGFAAFDPAYRTAGAIGDGLLAFWLLALHLLAVVTAIFAALERHPFSYRSWEAWSAGRLLEPETAPDPNDIPRSTSIGELVTGLIFVWLWLGLLGSATSHHVADTIRITLWPLYPAVYWAILAFLLAGVVLACVNLYRPWWTRTRAGARLATDALGLVICLAVVAGPFVEITAASPRGGVVELAKWANVSWYFTAALIALYCVARMVQDVRRASGRPPIRNLAMTSLGAD